MKFGYFYKLKKYLFVLGQVQIYFKFAANFANLKVGRRVSYLSPIGGECLLFEHIF